MKNIILSILLIILIIFVILYIKSQNIDHFIDSKYNCEETMQLRDKYYETPIDISVCKDKVTINSYDDYKNIDLKEFDLSVITNQKDLIDDKYFKITYYNSRDQDNNPIKLASIKSYLGLPGYQPANIQDFKGDLRYFEKNYNINIDDNLKKRVVSQPLNSVIDNIY